MENRTEEIAPEIGIFRLKLRYKAYGTRALRAELARHESVPAYVIFSNATLTDMAEKAPRSMEELLEVSGVGAKKAARYGRAFLQAIENYENER